MNKHRDCFEELARESVPLLPKRLFEGIRFGPAARYWAGNGPEWDVVALPEDKTRLLLGEVKWHEGESDVSKVEQAIQNLVKKGVPPTLNKRDLGIVHAVFMPKLSKSAAKRRYAARVVDAEQMVEVLV